LAKRLRKESKVRNRDAVRLLAAAVALVIASPLAQAQGPAVDAKRVRLGAPFSAGTVRRALGNARRRLERPGCQRVLTDFADEHGRPLQEALDREGTPSEALLDRLLFYDGTGQARCASRRTLAFTFPRSTIVFVCAEQFTEAAFRDPLTAEAALIHEGLHSIGLGENPPSSSAITARVLSRCRS
jgi:hypothetical protein